MKTSIKVLAVIIVIYLLGNACNDLNNPVSPTSQHNKYSSTTSGTELLLSGGGVADVVRINNYDVKFNGKTYDESTNQSTFSYTVSGTGVEPALNNFFIETPGCAGTPVSFTPTQSAKITDGGILWQASIATKDSSHYSITYNGNFLVGAVNAQVYAGNTTETKEIPGPCKGIHTISGSVYVDANSDQTMESSESGIGNITVLLTTPDGSVYTNKTSYTGGFTFSVFTDNKPTDFKLDVPSVTSDTTDFNELLFNSYTPTSNPVNQTVTADTTDVTGIDFGFAPQTQKLIQEFQDGTIQLKTEEPKFWIKQLRYAKNNNSNAEVSREALLGYLNVIEGLLIKSPFQFGDNKIDNALDILTKPTKTDLDNLLVQLLTAELNVVSGRGSNSHDFDMALLAYGESAAAQASGSFSAASSTATYTTTSTRDATDLLTSFNYSGGGGGVGN